MFDRAALQRIMWERVGLLRDEGGLRAASAELERMTAPAALDERSVEDRNLLDLGRLTVAAALARPESRGAHSRSDIPETRPGLARAIVSAARLRADQLDSSAPQESASAHTHREPREHPESHDTLNPRDPSDTEKTSAC